MFLSEKPIFYVLNIGESTQLGKDLDAAVAKRVIHAMLARFAGEVALGDVKGAVAFAHLERQTAERDGASGKVALDAGLSRGLDHFTVARVAPARGFGGVTFGAGCGAGVGWSSPACGSN